MEILLAQVSSDSDPLKTGEILADIPAHDLKSQPVAYTSPAYRTNHGGLIAIPAKGEKIIILKDENLKRGAPVYYYHSTVVAPDAIKSSDRDEKVQVLRDGNPDSTIYDDDTKNPTKYEFRADNASLEMQYKYSKRRIQDDITLSHGKGAEVNVGTAGVQIKNEDGKAKIVVSDGDLDTADKPNAANEIEINTTGPIKAVSEGASMRHAVIDGTDIVIENDSTGFNGVGALLDPTAGGLPVPAQKIGRTTLLQPDVIVPVNPEGIGNPLEPGYTPKSGNIRLKSKYRDIDLAAVGKYSKVNIITNSAKIKVDNYTGDIEIMTQRHNNLQTGPVAQSTGVGNIVLKSMDGNISLEAPNGTVSLNGQSVEVNGGLLGVNIKSQTNTNVEAIGAARVRGQTIAVLESPATAQVNAGFNASLTGNFGATINSPFLAGNPVSYGGTTALTLPVIPPVPVVTLPILPNDYNDGFPGIGAV